MAKRKFQKIIKEFCDEKGYDYDRVEPLLSEPYKIIRQEIENGNYAYITVPGVVSIRGKVGRLTWDKLLKNRDPYMLFIASSIKMHAQYIQERYKGKKKRWK